MASSPELHLAIASRDASDALGPADASRFLLARVRAEVRRIVGSAEFDASARNRRFLEYVVEETLAERGDRIKAYTIATTVFGRNSDFDPQLDPVVRMEARRLRGSLERFYLTDGKHSAVRITMPKGGYVPEFHDAPIASARRTLPAPDSRGQSDYASPVLVEQFEVEGDRSMFQSYEHGLTHQLLIALCRYPGLSVFGPRSRAHGRPAIEAETPPAGGDTGFVLTGSKAVIAGRLHVKAMLLEAATGRVLWGQDFERELHSKGILSVCDEVANSIVRTLAEPFGVIFGHRAQNGTRTDRSSLTMSESLLLFRQYRRSYRRTLFQPARESIENAVSMQADCAEALACLSHLCTDGHRFGFAPSEPAALLREQATALARKAIEMAPDKSCGYHALGMARWFQQDVEASLRATQTALALNTNALDVTADLGLHLALLGDWERALPLLASVSFADPAHVTAHRVGLSLDHFNAGRFQQALAEANEIHAPDVAHAHAVRAIALVRLDRPEEAAHAAGSVLEIDPHYGEHALSDLSGGNLFPAMADSVSEALGDAGLRGH